MSRVEDQPGLVLHRRPFRESSLIIELFTHGFGRAGLVARGARRPRSAWRGLVEPFRLLEAGWMRRGELGTLTGLEPVDRGHRLTGRALWCGLYANELLLRLLPRDLPTPDLFTDYLRLLSALSQPSGHSLALRQFEMALLEELGVAPELGRVADSGRPVEAHGHYRVDPLAGPFAATGPGPAVFSGRTLIALAEGRDADAETAREMRLLMRRLLDYHLDGRPLNTPRLYRRPA